MTANETWVPHCEPETKHQHMEYHHKDSYVGEALMDKVMATVFDTQVVVFIWTALNLRPPSTEEI